MKKILYVMMLLISSFGYGSSINVEAGSLLLFHSFSAGYEIDEDLQVEYSYDYGSDISTTAWVTQSLGLRHSLPFAAIVRYGIAVNRHVDSFLTSYGGVVSLGQRWSTSLSEHTNLTFGIDYFGVFLGRKDPSSSQYEQPGWHATPKLPNLIIGVRF